MTVKKPPLKACIQAYRSVPPCLYRPVVLVAVIQLSPPISPTPETWAFRSLEHIRSMVLPLCIHTAPEDPARLSCPVLAPIPRTYSIKGSATVYPHCTGRPRQDFLSRPCSYPPPHPSIAPLRSMPLTIMLRSQTLVPAMIFRSIASVVIRSQQLLDCADLILHRLRLVGPRSNADIALDPDNALLM
jgi:hypothetical protein